MNDQSQGQLTYIYELFRGMEDYTINQLYHGDFSTIITDNILSAVETCLLGVSSDLKLRKRLYFLTVESLQNITRHEEKIGPLYKGNCFFLLQGLTNTFYLTCGNYIANERIPALRARLDGINSLDTESLRAYAKELMEAGDYSGRGGAGLGLIEMARKSGHKLQYAFENFDAHVSYFYLQIKLDLSATAVPEISSKDNIAFTNAQYIHRLAHQHKLDFIYAGDFTEVQSNLINAMLKYTFNTANALFFDIASLLTANIAKHGSHHAAEAPKGIFIVNRTPGYLISTSGNWINKDNSKAYKLSELFNAGNAAAIPDVLGALTPIYTAVNGEMAFNLLQKNAQHDFFIVQVKTE